MLEAEGWRERFARRRGDGRRHPVRVGDRFWGLIPWLKPFALCRVPFRDEERDRWDGELLDNRGWVWRFRRG